MVVRNKPTGHFPSTTYRWHHFIAVNVNRYHDFRYHWCLEHYHGERDAPEHNNDNSYNNYRSKGMILSTHLIILSNKAQQKQVKAVLWRKLMVSEV